MACTAVVTGERPVGNTNWGPGGWDESKENEQRCNREAPEIGVGVHSFLGRCVRENVALVGRKVGRADGQVELVWGWDFGRRLVER